MDSPGIATVGPLVLNKRENRIPKHPSAPKELGPVRALTTCWKTDVPQQQLVCIFMSVTSRGYVGCEEKYLVGANGVRHISTGCSDLARKRCTPCQKTVRHWDKPRHGIPPGTGVTTKYTRLRPTSVTRGA